MRCSTMAPSRACQSPIAAIRQRQHSNRLFTTLRCARGQVPETKDTKDCNGKKGLTQWRKEQRLNHHGHDGHNELQWHVSNGEKRIRQPLLLSAPLREAPCRSFVSFVSFVVKLL